MTEFSKLVRRQAGQITLTGILVANVVAGAAIYGLYSSYQEKELVDGLRKTAAAMKSEQGSIAEIRGYFAAEAGRIESAHVKNKTLLERAEGLADWLPALPGSPTIADLRSEDALKYNSSKMLLQKQSVGSELVWTALTSPEKAAALKDGLTRDNLEVYAAVKDCALRKAGEGAYCGPSAAVGVRLAALLQQATHLQEESEAFARQSLGMGWDDWDAAQKNLTLTAFTEIDKSEKAAHASFDRGDLDQEDWSSMSNGFVAAKAEAAGQIQQDRQQLQARANSGGLSSFDWYLISRFAQSAPIQSSAHVVSHPYVAGGSSFVPPAQAFKSSPAPASAVVVAPSQRLAVAPMKPPTGLNPYSVDTGASRLGSKVNASFAQAAGPRISAAMSQAGSLGKSGMASRVASFSAAKSVARASGGSTSSSSSKVGVSSGSRVGVSSGG